MKRKAKKAGKKIEVICLSCNRPFKSKGPGYRICKACKKKQVAFVRTAHRIRYSEKFNGSDWR